MAPITTKVTVSHAIDAFFIRATPGLSLDPKSSTPEPQSRGSPQGEWRASQASATLFSALKCNIFCSSIGIFMPSRIRGPRQSCYRRALFTPNQAAWQGPGMNAISICDLATDDRDGVAVCLLLKPTTARWKIPNHRGRMQAQSLQVDDIDVGL